MAWDENGRYSEHGGFTLHSWVRANSPLSQRLSRMSDRIEKVSFPPASSSAPETPPPPKDP